MADVGATARFVHWLLFIMSSKPLSLVAALAAALLSACASSPESEHDIADDSASIYGATETALHASKAAADTRLATIENVLGYGMKAVSVRMRDTMNGRDVWLSMPANDGVRVWRTREDAMSLDAVAYDGTLKFVYTARAQESWGNTDPLHYTLSVFLGPDPAAPPKKIDLTVNALHGYRSYSLDVTDDEPYASLIGKLDDMVKITADDVMVRLFTLDEHANKPGSDKRYVVVLTDHGHDAVFPLDLKASRVAALSFANAKKITFDAYEGQPEKRVQYEVSWRTLDAASIRRVP